MQAERRAKALLDDTENMSVGSGYLDIYGIGSYDFATDILRVGLGTRAQARLSENWAAIADVKAYREETWKAEALVGARYKW